MIQASTKPSWNVRSNSKDDEVAVTEMVNNEFTKFEHKDGPFKKKLAECCENADYNPGKILAAACCCYCCELLLVVAVCCLLL